MQVCPALHAATWVDEVVVAHMGGSDGLDGQVGNPVIYFVVTRHDKAALLAVEVASDAKAYLIAITTTEQVWEIYNVPMEY